MNFFGGLRKKKKCRTTPSEPPPNNDQVQKGAASFTSFPNLPTEIRLQVWKLLLVETARTVEIHYNHSLHTWLSPNQIQAPLPALKVSHINQEARAEFLRIWAPLVPLAPTTWPKLRKGKNLATDSVETFPTSYFNPHLDTLCIYPPEPEPIERYAGLADSLDALNRLPLLEGGRLGSWKVKLCDNNECHHNYF